MVALAAATLPSVAGEHAPSDAPIQILGGQRDERKDADGDGRAETWSVYVPVRVAVAGTYAFEWHVVREDGVTSRAFGRTAYVGSGDHEVRLDVPGPYVHSFGVVDEFRVAVHPAGAEGNVDSSAFRVSAYAPASWASAPVAFLATPFAWTTDDSGDGQQDTFHVDVWLDASADGAYRLLACAHGLAASPTCAERVTRLSAWTIGVVSLTVPVPPGAAGVLTAHVSLELEDSSGMALASHRTPAISFRARSKVLADPAIIGALDGRDALASGLAVSIPVHLNESAALEAKVTWIDVGTGQLVRAEQSLRRFPAGAQACVAPSKPEEAAVLLRGSVRPVAYWVVMDAGGVTVAAGRVTAPAPPVAKIRPATVQVLAGENFTLDDAGGEPPASARVWSLDGERVATGQRASLQLTEPGEYEVELVVHGALTAARDVVIVRVKADRPPDVSRVASEWRLREGERSTLHLPIADPDGRPVEISLDDAPPGLTLAQGSLVWTPTYAQAGDYGLFVTASDGAREASVRIRTVVAEGTALPTIARADGLRAAETLTASPGETVRLRLKAAFPDGTPVALRADLPDHATFADGVLEWRPAVGDGDREVLLSTEGNGPVARHRILLHAVHIITTTPITKVTLPPNVTVTTPPSIPGSGSAGTSAESQPIGIPSAVLEVGALALFAAPAIAAIALGLRVGRRAGP